LAAVWDEQHGNARRIVARVAPAGGDFGAPVTLNEETTAFHPQTVAVPDGFLVAWTERVGDRSDILIGRVRRP